MRPFCNDSHKSSAQFSIVCFLAHIVSRCILSTSDTLKICAFGTLWRRRRIFSILYHKGNAITVNDRPNVSLVALFPGKHKAAGQRHLTATGRVGAFDSPGPDPGDDGCLTAALGGRNLHLGVQVANLLKSLLLHPLAIIAYVLCQAFRAGPAAAPIYWGAGFRVDWSLSGELGRNLDHGFVDHNRHRVQVVGMGLQSQPLGFQGNGTAASKGVQQRRRVVAGGTHDFCLCCIQNFRIVGVLPFDQLFKNSKQTLALLILRLFGGELLRVLGWIVHQAGPYHCAGRSKRPPSPPQVQCGRVPVPDRFLPSGLGVDSFQRKRHFNQFLCHDSILISGTQSPRCG